MLESTMSAAAGGAGGLMGQLGDILSAPRRFAWNALGMPDTGSQLLANTFGMDPESGWTKALGMGAEMVLDPLTYAGMLLGGPLAKLGAQGVNARRTAGLGADIERMTAAQLASQEAMAMRAAQEAETVRRYAAKGQELAAFDIPSIAAGKTHAYQYVDPDLLADMTGAGMATANPAGGMDALGGGMYRTGGRAAPSKVKPVPYGTELRQLGVGTGDKGLGGSMLGPAPGMEDVYKQMQPLLPEELASLQAHAKPRMGYNWRTSLNKDPSYINDWVNELASNANAARPMPTVGTHLDDAANQLARYAGMGPTPPPPLVPLTPMDPKRFAGLTLDAPPPLARPRFLDMPIDQAHSASQETMKQLLERKKQLDALNLATSLGVRDYAQVAGGSYLGSLGLGSDR